MEDRDFMKIVKYAQVMLEIKTIELRIKIPNIKILDVTDYLFNILLKNKKIKDVNDLAYYIYNIKINKLIEYINVNTIIASDSNLEKDIEALLK
ncbi:post-transcriptional regulator [Spiroplasma endosymbiont of Labia minor]|uniref:post-transcriptional regulator n=1 Tax=Spiroplasma endosymbiont of Labia minor TaxID=3066305 RepID=UPI0030D23BA5